MKESDDLVAQNDLIKKRFIEVNKLRGLDTFRWKHEISHIKEIKRLMDTGRRIYSNVNELMLALNPAPLPEYVKENYEGKKK